MCVSWPGSATSSGFKVQIAGGGAPLRRNEAETEATLVYWTELCRSTYKSGCAWAEWVLLISRF